jgi:hypothetical protein
MMYNRLIETDIRKGFKGYAAASNAKFVFIDFLNKYCYTSEGIRIALVVR